MVDFAVEVEEDESLRKWKEQLLGGIDVSAVGGTYFPSTFVFLLEQLYNNY